MWKQSDTADAEEAKALQAEARSIKPVERYYWNAIVRVLTNKQGTVEKDVGPRIFSCGKQLQSKLLRAMTGDDVVGIEGLGDITDTEGVEGRDLQVIKRLVKGSGDEKYPNYNESVFKNPSPAGSAAQVSEWLSNLHDLNTLRRILPTDELAREVRIHRGLEKDPELQAYEDSINIEADDEPVVVRQPAKPVAQTRPAATATVQRPVQKPVRVVDEDTDSALADEDFLNKLKSM